MTTLPMNLRTFTKLFALLLGFALCGFVPQTNASTNCSAVQLDVVSKAKVFRNIFAYSLLARVPSPNQGVESKLNGIPTGTPVDLGNGFYRVNVVSQPGTVWFFRVKTAQGLEFDCSLTLP